MITLLKDRRHLISNYNLPLLQKQNKVLQLLRVVLEIKHEGPQVGPVLVRDRVHDKSAADLADHIGHLRPLQVFFLYEIDSDCRFYV